MNSRHYRGTHRDNTEEGIRRGHRRDRAWVPLYPGRHRVAQAQRAEAGRVGVVVALGCVLFAPVAMILLSYVLGSGPASSEPSPCAVATAAAEQLAAASTISHTETQQALATAQGVVNAAYSQDDAETRRLAASMNQHIVAANAADLPTRIRVYQDAAAQCKADQR